MSSPISVNFGLGRLAHKPIYTSHLGKKEKLGQTPILISSGKKTLRRSSAGQSELGAAASRKAMWWDLRLESRRTCFCLFVCIVTDFSAAEKNRGLKLCVRVRLLSGMRFSHFDELWLAGSHGGGITSGMYAATNWMQATAPGEARWGFGIGCRGSVGQSESLLKAVCGICVLQAC